MAMSVVTAKADTQQPDRSQPQGASPNGPNMLHEIGQHSAIVQVAHLNIYLDIICMCSSKDTLIRGNILGAVERQ